MLRIPGSASPATDCCLRNLAVGALGRAGPVNLAAALRQHAHDAPAPATLRIILG